LPPSSLRNVGIISHYYTVSLAKPSEFNSVGYHRTLVRFPLMLLLWSRMLMK